MKAITFVSVFLFFIVNFTAGFYGYKENNNKALVLNYDDISDSYIPPSDSNEIHQRIPRAILISKNVTDKINIKLNYLNDSRQQLIVHWAGEGSQVIICIARDPKEIVKTRQPLHSAVYISYNYGETFENKTSHFQLKPDKYAHIEKFHIHPRFNTISAYVDPENKKIFTTDNDGKSFLSSNISFTPSELSFDPVFPKSFVVHDKVDPSRKLYYTNDLGSHFTVLQEMVKSFEWVVLDEIKNYKQLVVQRIESNTTNIVAIRKLGFFSSVEADLFSGAEDFYVKGDYMFATRRTVKNCKDLYISYKGNAFIKANFSTTLETRDFHIADITENKIFVAVAHHELLSNLYISDVIDDKTTFALFSLSFERILCYFRNITWTKSIINDIAENDFIDLHKLDGLRGIYIASAVSPSSNESSDINPDHLSTMITYDWGYSWYHLNVTHTLNGIPCKLEENCSLHLSQKFASWYPSTLRYAPILSSKSAPGIVIATGTLGTSLKGHPGVFISKDNGVTWRQILRDNYYYNMGDHAGIIIAMKLVYKLKNESNEILYSTDEGESFRTYKLQCLPLKIYSVMTEAGENTTVFSLFGSLPDVHKWVVVRVDFRNVFSTNCSFSDYKIWRPSSNRDPKQCVMGQNEKFRRRIPSIECYNGMNNTLRLSSEVCLCRRDDFTCDTGFYRDKTTFHCIRDKSYSKDPYAIPKQCPPYTFYNRTRGYRKISRDVCVGGDSDIYLPDQIACPINETNEFLLLAQKDKILTFPLTGLKSETLPVKNLVNVIAVEYDMRKNCLYYADIVEDVIARVCFNGNNTGPEFLVRTNLQSVEGMSLDWVSNHLYFVDGAGKKIEVIRTNTHIFAHMRKTILDNKVVKKPRGIAVHPMAGYIFWSDWNTEEPYIGRAELDGSNPRRLFEKPIIEWPNGITIDFIANRIYWVDARLDYIASSNLKGLEFKKVIEHNVKVSHPFSVAIFKDSMYWDDWKQSSVFVADKDHGTGIQFIATALSGLMDLKVYSHSVQEGTNRCANNTECSHLCFGTPNNGFLCQCPDGLVLSGKTKCLCPGGHTPTVNGTCPLVNNTCSSGDLFQCRNGLCIENSSRCDGDDDCGDKSDEEDCIGRLSCQANKFQCDNGRCIPSYWRCDHDHDCEDSSDEKDCPYSACKPEQFTCDNGRCISKSWVCDTEDDCRDGSDEKNCTTHSLPTAICRDDEFKCNNSQCIPANWKCDNERDCTDNSDELNCTSNVCESWQFACRNGKCIFKTWTCDGQDDCKDGFRSDENNCETTVGTTDKEAVTTPSLTCQSWMFHCDHKTCIPYWWKCDHVNDCFDGSDEVGCFQANSTTKSPAPTPPPIVCQDYQFRCLSGHCIMDSWVCDGAKDCLGGEDEKNCNSTHYSCGSESPSFKCRSSGLCIREQDVCNGIVDCPDRSDEEGCGSLTTDARPSKCEPGYFICDFDKCVSEIDRCNKVLDCMDGSDEKNCAHYVKMALIEAINVSDTALTVTWFIHPLSLSGNNRTYEFLPSITLSSAPNSRRNPVWITDTRYRFENLTAYEFYNITVYIRDKLTQEISPPSYILHIRTAQGVPDSPRNLTVAKRNSHQLDVQWKSPVNVRGVLVEYLVWAVPVSPPLLQHVAHFLTSCVITLDLKPNTTYSISVVAVNEEHKSAPSVVTVTFADEPVSRVRNLKVSSFTHNTVTLTWTAIRGKTFVINTGGSIHGLKYPGVPTARTVDNSYTVTNLSPGVSYVFEVGVDEQSEIQEYAITLARTAGDQLPLINNITYKMKESAIHLKWSRPPNKENNKLSYGIYYGETLREILNGSRYLVDKEETTITSIGYCKSILVTVGIVAEIGVGPLKDPVMVETPLDPKAAPSQLSLIRHDKKSALIEWHASCTRVKDPIGYIVTVNDTAISATFNINITSTNSVRVNTTMALDYGGVYTVMVSTSANGAMMSPSLNFTGPTIPVPEELSASIGSNNNCLVYWNSDNVDPDIKKIGYHYVIFHQKGHSLGSHPQTYKADYSPYVIHNLKNNETHSFAIQMVMTTGHQSERSEIFIHVPEFWQPEPSESRKGNNGYAILIVSVLLSISVLLGFIYWKHTKNQHSFQNLANSHYDTRSGSTTFSGVNGLDGEDLSDTRECFPDDEPLVTA